MKLEGNRVSRERHHIGYMPAVTLSSTPHRHNIPPISPTMPRLARRKRSTKRGVVVIASDGAGHRMEEVP